MSEKAPIQPMRYQPREVQDAYRLLIEVGIIKEPVGYRADPPRPHLLDPPGVREIGFVPPIYEQMKMYPYHLATMAKM